MCKISDCLLKWPPYRLIKCVFLLLLLPSRCGSFFLKAAITIITFRVIYQKLSQDCWPSQKYHTMFCGIKLTALCSEQNNWKDLLIAFCVCLCVLCVCVCVSLSVSQLLIRAFSWRLALTRGVSPPLCARLSLGAVALSPGLNHLISCDSLWACVSSHVGAQPLLIEWPSV